MDSSELHTDGNGAAGMLQEIFAVEMTSVRRVCDGCGSEHPIGEHLAYQGAGTVLRCPSCGAEAAFVSALPGEYVIGLRGAWRVSRSAG
ncbi:MAG TPA: DUF6510 family protein [Thermoleophilaceae bacterium]|jgi:hypothetical protein|nr:DUF6510 family protein [Thermoleophilaceae bacterium]